MQCKLKKASWKRKASKKSVSRKYELSRKSVGIYVKVNMWNENSRSKSYDCKNEGEMVVLLNIKI